MQKSKSSKIYYASALLIQAVLLIIIYELINNITGSLNMGRGLLIFIILITVSFILAVNIHESGHLVFGKLLGYRLLIFQFSVFAFINQNGRMKFTLRITKGVSGYCAMAPDKEMPLYKHALYYSGGIIFNILSGIAFTLLFVLTPGLPEEWRLLFIYLAGFSCFLGLANLIPLYSGNSASDGMLLWNIILKRPLAKKLLEYNKIMAQLTGGIRPGEIDIPEDTEDDTFALQSGTKLLGYFRALDLGDTEKAAELAGWLEEHIDDIPTPSLPGVYYELCYTGCVKSDFAKAKKYFDKSGKILKNDMDVNGLRVKAYYAYYIERDKEKALKLIDKALEVAHKFPVRGQGVMEEALIKKLRALITASL